VKGRRVEYRVKERRGIGRDRRGGGIGKKKGAWLKTGEVGKK